MRLKFAATINDEALPENVDPDFEIAYIDIGNVDSSGTIHEIVDYRFEAAPSRARRIVRDGDVIISTVRTYLQAIAPIISPPENLIVSTGFAVVRPRPGQLDPGFCRYAVREPRFLAEVEMRSTGISYPAINASEIGDISIALPELPVQQRTSAFLDAELTQLDTLIEAKQKLLGLLAEKRRTLVAEAVMRGLNRSAPVRPSGIDWLGDIPGHWASVPLRYLVSFMGGATPDTKNEEYWAGDIPWVSPKDMKRDFITDAEDHVSEQALADSALKMIDEGAVLIVVRGMILAHSFPTAVNTVPVTINQDMKALRCDERISPRFLKAVLEGATQYLVDQADSSAHGTKKLETGVLGALGIPVPPLDEQEQIVARIAEERVKIDKLATATQRSITLLKERRSALIAAAVTGQIAIPEAA
jgi:type I restriction enzyme S subunit